MSSRNALDLYRDDWSTRHAEVMREHAERMQQLEDDHKAWLAGYLKEISGAADEGAQDVGEGQRADMSAGLPASPAGPAPHQLDPQAAELARAREIADMPMNEYAARRAELGVQSPSAMNRLFAEERR
jgi:hypothetical protein